MKIVEIITIKDCLACEFVGSVLQDICKNTDIKCNIVTCNRNVANTKYKTNVFPTVIIRENIREIARIFGSMPADFYKTVIDKFEKL